MIFRYILSVECFSWSRGSEIPSRSLPRDRRLDVYPHTYFHDLDRKRLTPGMVAHQSISESALCYLHADRGPIEPSNTAQVLWIEIEWLECYYVFVRLLVFDYSWKSWYP